MSKSGRVRSLFAFALATLVVTSCSVGPPPPEPRGEGPSLVVLIVIDQGRPDYLTRFRPLLSGGLAWLLDNGAVFTDAHHNHAITATAPGHATLASGRFPAHTGIYSNYWFDVETQEEAYSAGESSSPSPVHLWGTTFADWLKDRDARSKVFTASPKDRSAVLMGGHGADAAISYWHSEGIWWTGDYYDGPTGDWFDSSLERQWLDDYFGSLWEPLVTDPAVWAEHGITHLETGVFASGFPYPIGRPDVEPDSAFYRAIYSTPMMDGYLAELGKAMIDGEQLGADGSIDFLGLSFSATDAVGHDFGPNSPEILDTLLRLDGYLGELIDHIDEVVGLEHVIFALSADHGVATMPEYLELVGEGEGKRLDAEDIRCVQNAGRQFRERFGEADWFLSGFYLDVATIESQGTTVAEVESAMAALLEECAAIEKVWTSTELTTPGSTDANDPMAELHRNNHVPGRAPNLTVQLKSGYLYYPGRGTTHGSAHAYDTHVPLILAGPGIAPGVIDQRVHTVDLAPTLAALIGLTPPEDLDGVDRSALITADPGR